MAGYELKYRELVSVLSISGICSRSDAHPVICEKISEMSKRYMRLENIISLAGDIANDLGVTKLRKGRGE
jgi:hypothetical protein